MEVAHDYDTLTHDRLGRMPEGHVPVEVEVEVHCDLIDNE